MTELPAWNTVVAPHDDIKRGELDISAYAADLGGVDRRDEKVPMVYRRADEFFRTTYLTRNLRRLLVDVMSVIGGGGGDRVIQLRTPFGGGKTHSLLALLHLMRSRDEIDPQLIDGIPDPGPGRVVVLSGIDLDPFGPREVDGLSIRTLWGELAYRLGGAETYELVRVQDEEGAAPGGDTLREVIGRRPTLILLDEVLVYVESAGGDSGDNPRRRQALVFLQKLTEVVRNLPHAAMVYSLQASTHEAAGDEVLLTELEKLVTRVDAKREPVADDELTNVVQRRLFPTFGSDPEHLRVAAEVAHEYATAYRRTREAYGQTTADRRAASVEAERFEQRIRDSYPFHPALLDLMYHRWGSLPSYQRTRGALSFLARVVHALWDGTRPARALIAPGDAPLEDELVRGAFFSQVGQPREQFTSVLNADVVGSEARARIVDERLGSDSPRLNALRLGTRTATAIMLYSFGARETEQPGVVESDLVGALTMPDVDRNVLTATLSDLRDDLLYLHDAGRRYRFEPKPNLNLLIAEETKKLEADEVRGRISRELGSVLRSAGDHALIWPQDSGAIPDHDARFRIAYLAPDVAAMDEAARIDHVETLLNTAGKQRRDYKNALAFAVPGLAMLDRSRERATMVLALENLERDIKSGRHTVQPHQRDDLADRRRGAEAELSGAVDALYQAVLVPVPDREGSAPFRFESVDLRAQLTAGRDLHRRLLDGLRKYVFESITPSRLASLAKLGAEREWVACGDLRDWFFSYLDFPKLVTPEAIIRAIATGTESTFGYVASGTVRDGELMVDRGELVRFSAPVSELEVDLGEGSFIVTPSLATHLRGDSEESSEPDRAGEDGSGDDDADRADEDGSAGAIGDAARTAYHLGASVDAVQFFRILPALQNLADRADSVTIRLDIDAEASAGFERAWLRNAVEEHLDEAGVIPEDR